MTSEAIEAIIQIIYYLYGIVIAHFMISGIVNEMWKILREESKRGPRAVISSSLQIESSLRTYPWQTAIVGILERLARI